MRCVIVVCLSLVAVFRALPGFANTESHVGVILEGYEGNCTVKNNGISSHCLKNGHLYVGDVITRSPDIKKVKIKWAPYASGIELGTSALKVAFVPPGTKMSVPHLIDSISDYFGFVKADNPVVIGATRGFDGVQSQQPYDSAMVLPGLAIKFQDRADGTSFLMYGADGKILYSAKMAGDITLIPAQIGMKAGKTYYWQIDGGANPKHMVQVLGGDDLISVTRELEQLETGRGGITAQLLAKAALFQIISMWYPDRFDLWTNSMAMLGQLSDNDLSPEDLTLKKSLAAAYLNHERGE